MAERKQGQHGPVRNAGATARVLDYLRRNSDVVIPYQEIMRELDLPDYTISNSVGYLIARNDLAMERPMKGTVILHSAPTPPLIIGEPTQKKIVETDVVSAFPEQLLDKVKGFNSEYGMHVDYSPDYEYVGKMGERDIIRDTGDQLFVAIPLLEWVVQR